MDSSENIGNVLFCSSLLEKRAYEMYYELSQRIEHPVIRKLLMTIAQDSLKHSLLFEEVTKKFFSVAPKEKECKKQVGIIWKRIDEVTKFVKRKNVIGPEDLLGIITKLSFVEYRMGEEYSVLEQVKTLKYMNHEISEMYRIDFEGILRSQKRVFDSIISDERLHGETLFEVGEFLTKKDAQKDNHPKFKYQTPDAWTFLPPKKEVN